MRFIDGVSVNQAKAYVNKQEAFWREDYMSSGFYRDMSFDEFITQMGINEHRDGLKKALQELMEKQSEEISLMKKYRAINKNNELFDFHAINSEEVRHWTINHLDMSREWFVFEVISYEEASQMYIKDEREIFELRDDGSETQLYDFSYAPEDETVFGIEVTL